jgi:mRNA interferase MazF
MVISNSSFGRSHRHSVLAMITTAVDQWPTDVNIEAWQDAGLRAPCKIGFKLFTLDNEIICGSIGSLSSEDCCAVRSQLSNVMAVA